MNTKYGRLAEGRIEYAPDSLETAGGVTINPSRESYLAAGWKPVVDEPPAAEPGCRVEVTRWTEDAETVTCVYKQVPGAAPAPAARTFSKLKVVIALKEKGLWVLTKAWIEENGLYDHYLAASDFSEANEFFRRGRDELKSLARLTDGQVEEILAACVAE